jgi:hypothetical protein
MFTVCAISCSKKFEDFLVLTSDSASLLDEAKRWFESSTVICKFVPDGQKRADKVRLLMLVADVEVLCSQQISETYTQLLARY